MTAGADAPLAGPQLAGIRAAFALTFAFALAPFMAAGGAIGVPALAALAALIALPRPGLWARIGERGLALPAAAAFLGWATLTLIWSPADSRQILATWAEVVLGAGLLLAASYLPERMRRWPRVVFVTSMTAFTLFMALESVTGAAITAWITGAVPGDERVLGNLGRGAAAMIILTPPAVVMALAMGKPWRGAGYIILFSVFAAAIGLETDANVLALLVTVLAFFIARRRPKTAVLAFGFGAAAWIVIFPLLVLLADPFVQARRAEIPFSWEWRWEAWSYALELIAQKPLFGWGMDSARHFGGATVNMRGFELSRMPLHTHSASLQIWLELGLAGVALACGALILGAWRIAMSPLLGRYGAASAAGAAVAVAFVASTSYGFWQEWLWSTAILSAAACFLTAPGPGAPERAP